MRERRTAVTQNLFFNFPGQQYLKALKALDQLNVKQSDSTANRSYC